MIGFYDGERYYNFDRLEDFLNLVLSRKYRNWRIFGHYGGKFDLTYLFDYIRENHPDWDFNFYCAGSCVISFTVRRGELRWRFTDSFRLMDAPLDNLTQEFDVAHKKLAFDPTSIEYNRHDCIGLYEVLTRFFGAFQEFVTSETIAAHAMRIYRLLYLKKPIFAIPRNAEDFIRQSYFGGRVEVFRHDETKINKYDVNSLYPYCMLQPVPVAFKGFTLRVPDYDEEVGFYRAEIKYPDRYLPVLPTVIDHKLFFPVGRFEGVFTSMELRRAIDHGAAVSIKSGVVFEAEPILAEFATDLYKMKVKAEREGNKYIRYVMKKVMNSLYGKFGQRRLQKVYLLDPGTPRLDMDDPESPIIFPLLNGIAYHERESRSCSILPHIASAITSYARLSIHGHLSKARRVWYTDTDSVFTPNQMRTADTLGDLKNEGSGRFQAFGLKEYKFNDRYYIKGLSVYKTDPLTGEKTEDITIAERYLKGEKIEITRRAGILESIRAGERAVRRIHTHKQRHPRIEKRARVGLDTRPWNAAEIL